MRKMVIPAKAANYDTVLYIVEQAIGIFSSFFSLIEQLIKFFTTYVSS